MDWNPCIRCFLHGLACSFKLLKRPNTGWLQWWGVDLGKATTVSRVVIYTRGSLQGLKIRVGWLPPTNSTHFDESATCATESSQPGSPARYTCTPALTGRYVSLRLEGRDEYMINYEVQVFGKPWGEFRSQL